MFKIKNINCGLFVMKSIVGISVSFLRFLVEVDLLRCVRLMVNRLHVLWMNAGVGVVEHLLHCR